MIKSHKCDLLNCGYSLTAPVVTHMLTKWPVLGGSSSQWPSCCICNFTAVTESMYKNPFPISHYISSHSYKEGNVA